MNIECGPLALAGAFLVGMVTATAGALSSASPAPPAVVRVPMKLDGRPKQPMSNGPGMTLVGPAPESQHNVVFTNGQLLVGVARYEKMELELKDYPTDEFMYFLEGEVDITDARGVTQHIKAGDAIVLPRGFSGHWQQRGPLRKIAVMNVEPHAAGAAK